MIAGILGLGFGELKDREVARARTRARLYGAIAAVFALLAIIAGISAWRAVEQTRRAEAELSRAEAAILVAVEGVAKIVDQVAAGSESGEIPTGLAKSMLMTADGIIAGVVGLAPNNPRLLEEQGRVLILFARHYQAVGDIEAWKAAAKRARDLFAELEAWSDGTEEAARLRSVALDERGDASMAEGDRAGALKAYEESLEIRRRLAVPIPATPNGARRLGSRQGRRRARRGDRAGAVQASEESLGDRERLAAADPGDADIADVASSLDRIGDVRVAEGDRGGALAAYAESLEIARRLAAADPSNAGWARAVAVA